MPITMNTSPMLIAAWSGGTGITSPRKTRWLACPAATFLAEDDPAGIPAAAAAASEYGIRPFTAIAAPLSSPPAMAAQEAACITGDRPDRLVTTHHRANAKVRPKRGDRSTRLAGSGSDDVDSCTT
ncbi:hypothetical protein ABIA33_007363 [Streptacidiphilus sp. MAP12-16]